MSLKVARIAPGASLQDSGRPGYRHFGVPLSGVFDRRSAIIANLSVGNADFDPVVELMQGVTEFEVLEPTSVGLYGAQASVKLIRERPHASGGLFALLPGDRLLIDGFASGARLYLALPGGIRGPKSLGSVSGHAIGAGDVLTAQRPGTTRKRLGQGQPSFANTQTLEAIAGPHLTSELAEITGSQSLIVHPHSDRRGIRLNGSMPTHQIRLASEPQCIGSIQWTPSGELILIGPDGPTIGGYPQIGFVIEADISRMGQLRPGMEVALRWVTPEQAADERQDELNLMRLHRKLAAINYSY